MNMKRGGKRFFGALIFLVVFAAAVAVVMLLWNALIPQIIGWSSISYLQAAGLVILSRLLIGGFGKGFHHHFCHGHGHASKEHIDHMRDMRAGLKDMSKEERREFIRAHIAFHSAQQGCKDDKASQQE